VRLSLFLIFAVLIGACQPKVDADILIVNGAVYLGDNTSSKNFAVAIKDERIVYVGENSDRIVAEHTIDASGLWVLPGFIDPHTHSMGELQSNERKKRANINYLTQGVTTVVNGNDGFGDPDIAELSLSLNSNGIGTNTALFIGHGALREKIMAREKRAPTADELAAMKAEMTAGMEAGALGLSTGLFYAPGSFSETDEIISLAKVASEHGGVYDSHIRDEATYNIGLEAAVDEVIQIARKANIHANIAHIKALGVDVWGKSESLIAKVEQARLEGLSVSADQYPWQASGTRISNALLPRWVKAGSADDYMARLNDPELLPKIRIETKENLRKRGGPSTGHPRKYASYPQKYKEYVIGKSIMPIETFFYRSSGLVAETFGICERGFMREGYFADIIIIDPDSYGPKANFQSPAKLSEGVAYNFVNGEPIIKASKLQDKLPGRYIPRCQNTDKENAE